MPEQDFSALTAAMVVNDQFKRLILDPKTRQRTILEGYLGQIFDFTEEELGEILDIQTDQLPTFAKELDTIKKKFYP